MMTQSIHETTLHFKVKDQEIHNLIGYSSDQLFFFLNVFCLLKYETWSKKLLQCHKKERIHRRAFNMNHWSMMPTRQINRMIDLLEEIKDIKKHNKEYDDYIQGNIHYQSPMYIRNKYPLFELSESDTESSNYASISSNDFPVESPSPHKHLRSSSNFNITEWSQLRCQRIRKMNSDTKVLSPK